MTVPLRAAPLDTERWAHRVLLVFAPGVGGALDQQAAAVLAERNGLAERDTLVLRVVGNAVSAAFGTPAGPLPEAAALREAYGVPLATPFTVVLVGKDGSEKLRSGEAVSAAELFGVIDAMPMRRSGG